MLYYTQLIFIKQGQEETFHAFEENVLPFLQQYNGQLIYRLRPDKNSIVEINQPLPYEIHLVTFASKADFENYKNDPNRIAFLEMKNKSVEKIILIEGVEL